MKREKTRFLAFVCVFALVFALMSPVFAEEAGTADPTQETESTEPAEPKGASVDSEAGDDKSAERDEVSAENEPIPTGEEENAESTISAQADETGPETDDDGFIRGAEEGSDYWWKLDEDGTLTIKGTKMTSRSWNPAWINEKENIKIVVILPGIENIGYYAFSDCPNLASVTIPDSVTFIDEHAFYKCLGLTNITLPDSVTGFGSYAFGYSGLKEIIIPGSITNMNSSAFCGCDNLVSVMLMDGVKSIGGDTFKNCKNLKSVIIPDSVVKIGDFAFDDCISLSGNFIFPEGTTKIGEYILHCTRIENITIPDGVTGIGQRAFSENNALRTAKIPDSVTDLGAYAFSMCFNLSDTNIPLGVTEISNGAFNECRSLKNIIIHDRVTIIGEYAFSGCRSLTEITIPASVNYIGQMAFDSCSKLSTVHFEGDAPSFGKNSFCDATATVCYPAGNKTWTEEVRQNYGGTLTWVAVDENGNLVDSDKTEISDDMDGFIRGTEENSDYWWKLDENGTLTIKGTKMADYDLDYWNDPILAPWYSCKSEIKKLIIQTGIQNVGKNAFESCSELEDVAIPESVKKIDDRAFSGCSKIREIIIPDGVTSIGQYTFSRCNNIKNVFIPDSVEEIWHGAFADCGSLIAIDVDENNPMYSSYDGILYTKDCATLLQMPRAKAVGSIVIPNFVISIGSDAFYGCEEMTEITIPEGVEIIEDGAFMGCYGLLHIDIPSSVLELQANAFYNCYIESIKIRGDTTKIGNYIFCSNSLSKIYFENDIPQIDPEAFAAVSATVYYPANNSTYTEENKQNYGGTLTWIAVDENGNPVDQEKPEIPDDMDGFICGTEENSNYWWKLDENGTLTIKGTKMPDFDYWDHFAPWSGKYYTYAVIQTGMQNIGACAFYKGKDLVHAEIPDSVTGIGRDAFSYCTKLEDIAFSDNIDFVDYNAFRNTGIKSLTIPDTIGVIQSNCFMECKNLTEVTFTGAVTIWPDAFAQCSALNTIYFRGDVPYIQADPFHSMRRYPHFEGVTATAYYPAQNETWTNEKVEWLKSTFPNITWLANGGPTDPDDWSGFIRGTEEYSDYWWKLDEDGTLTIRGTQMPDWTSSGYAPWGWSPKRVIIEPGIENIGCHAFSRCSDLEQVSVPASVSVIGENAFSACSNLPSITLPNGVKEIGFSAFSSCSKLSEIDFPESLTAIAPWAFAGCDALNVVRFTGNALYIKPDAFVDVAATVYYPAGNTTWTDDVRQDYGGTLTWVEEGSSSAPENPAIPDQLAGDLVERVIATGGDYTLALQLRESLLTSKAIPVDARITEAMYLAIMANGGLARGYQAAGDVYVYATYPESFTEGLQFARVEVYALLNKLVLDLNFPEEKQSPLGVYMTVYLKESFDPNLTYRWSCDDGSTGYTNVTSCDTNGYKTCVTFYAPHFSTYTITPILQNVTLDGMAAESPILKRTGSDVSAVPGIVFVLSAAVILVCALPRRRKNVR